MFSADNFSLGYLAKEFICECYVQGSAKIYGMVIVFQNISLSPADGRHIPAFWQGYVLRRVSCNNQAGFCQYTVHSPDHQHI